MHIFIFDWVNHVTNHYHENGSLAIIASDIDHAKMIVSENADIKLTDKEWASWCSYPLEWSHTPRYWVFPNNGCC